MTAVLSNDGDGGLCPSGSTLTVEMVAGNSEDSGDGHGVNRGGLNGGTAGRMAVRWRQRFDRLRTTDTTTATLAVTGNGGGDGERLASGRRQCR